MIEQIHNLYNLGFQAIASLLTEVTIVRGTGSSYDPSTGQVTEATEEQAVKGLLRNVKTSLVDGTHVYANDMVFVTTKEWFSGFQVNPETDTVVAGGVTYRIVPPVRQDPSGFVISLQLRVVG